MAIRGFNVNPVRNLPTPLPEISSPIRSSTTFLPAHHSIFRIGVVRNMIVTQAWFMAGHQSAMRARRGYDTCFGNYALVVKRASCWPMD